MKFKYPKNLFSKYAGMDVVLVDGKVVSASKDASEAMTQAQKKYSIEKMTLFSVPIKGYKHMLLWFSRTSIRSR